MTSTADSGPGSLRDTIASASPGDTVFVPAAASHYAVTSGEIQIADAVTIEGAGVSSSIVDAQGSNRVFEVTASAGGPGVTFENLSITGGSTASAPGGGGILVDAGAGALTLLNAAVTGNTVDVSMGTAPAGGGGGVYNAGGDTILTNSSVSDNTATVATEGSCCHGGGGLYGDAGSITISASTLDGNQLTVTGPHGSNGTESWCCDGGGALYQRGPAPTTISASTLNGNSATLTTGDCCQGGGAIAVARNANESLLVTSSTLRGNSATISSEDCCNGGGAIQYNPDTDGSPASSMSVINTLIADNTAAFTGSTQDSGGGGVFDDNDGDRYINSTITGNSSDARASANSGGGGLVLFGNFLHQAYAFANVTISDNSAPTGLGGGVLTANSAASRFKNSILALNTASSGADCSAHDGSLGYNLEDAPDTCGFAAAGDQVVPASSIGLGPVADNGGPTMTQALLAGSLAIDAGNPAGCTDPLGLPLAVDQRGFLRPSGSRCDIGAFELEQSPFTPPVPPGGGGGGGGGGGSNVVPGTHPSPHAEPQCKVSLASATIFLSVRKTGKHRPNHSKVHSGKTVGNRGTASVVVECNQDAQASLTGKLVGRAGRNHRHWVAALPATSATLRAGITSVLVVKLPKLALDGLARGQREWVQFTLVARDANGAAIAMTPRVTLIGAPRSG